MLRLEERIKLAPKLNQTIVFQINHCQKNWERDSSGGVIRIFRINEQIGSTKSHI